MGIGPRRFQKKSSRGRIGKRVTLIGLTAWLVASLTHAQPPAPAVPAPDAVNLPSEAVLPTDPRTSPAALPPAAVAPSNASATPPQPSAAEELPDESVLPSERLTRPSPAPRVASPPTPDPTPNLAPVEPSQPEGLPGNGPAVDGVELPDESVLASAFTDPAAPAEGTPAIRSAEAQGGPDAVAALDSDASPGEARPFLRLNYEGPTERVRSLALSADGRWAVSGGEDKVLHVWQRAADRGWLHRRTVRWQVQRGQAGRIQRVAIRDRLAAFAGYGASGGIGEIWIVDVATGDLSRALFEPETAHRQTIAHLDWAPGDQPALVSADVEGRVVLWRPDSRTGLWSGKVLVDRDEVTYGPQRANYLAATRAFVPFSFVGPDRIVVPKFVGQTANQSRLPLWRLELVPLDGQNRVLLDRSDHTHLVVSLAASADGLRLASADGTGRLRSWELPGPVAGRPPNGSIRRVIELIKPGVSGQTLDLDWDASGRRLAVAYSGGVVRTAGGATTPHAGGGVDLWDFSSANPRRTSTLVVPQAAFAVRLSGAGDEAWLSQGSQIQIHRIDSQSRIGAQPNQRLATPIRPVREVAFVDRNDRYEVATRWDESWETSFDLSSVQIGREAQVAPDRLRSAQPSGPRWSTRNETDAAGDGFRLYFGDQPRARLNWKPELHGSPTAIAVISSAAPVAEADDADSPTRRTAIAIGSSFRNNIYVYEAPLPGSDEPPKLLRQFRGHSGAVRSLSVSVDGRYLASGSDDATVGIWPLAGLWEATPLEAQWGIDLEQTAGGLEVTTAREDGPLFFRGVREGDRLVEIRWVDPSAPANVLRQTEPAAILQTLEDLPFDTLVVFQWQRRDEGLPEFQSYPAWQPLAQLLLDRDREWAFWTPAGIYDASVNGHRRFGWQVNRGIDRLPDFYRADQFRERLERPEVLRRLLGRGSLAGALLAASDGTAPVGEAAIVSQLRARPEIEWLGPDPTLEVGGDRLRVEARVRLPVGVDRGVVKLFADGIRAPQSQLLGTTTEEGRLVEHHRWTMPLSRSPQVLVELVATTPAGVFDRLTQVLRRRIDGDVPTGKPRLHLIAVGVGDYRDPQISSLDFAARGAAEIHDLFARSAAPLYRLEGTQLLDQDAIRPLWNLQVGGLIERLSGRVGPDDLVVMYLCGHGLRDPITGRWYFVTADARHHDLMNDRFTDCLSFDDLTSLASLPCRKLAILDSCHSGAVQPTMHTEDLKAALRFLQEDRILTLTASEGHQEAAEDRDARLGRFTAHLIAALEGAADGAVDENWGGGRGTTDGIITLDETIAYVRRMLAEEARRDGFVQRPTAGPSDWIRSIRLPLTATGESLTAR